MTDKKTSQEADIQEAQTTAVETVESQEINIDISLPPAPLSIEVWQTYIDGRKRYEESVTYADVTLARYHGVRECFLRNFIHIHGMDRITDQLKKEDQKTGCDMEIASWLAVFVAIPLENRAFAFPTTWVPKLRT